MLKVVLSAAFGGGFPYHAEAVYEQGYLHKVLTSRPDLLTNKVDSAKIVSYVLPELVMRLSAQIPFVRHHFPGEYLKAQMFDFWAAQQIEHCDIVVAFAVFALHTLRAAKPYGVITIVERGSAHILYQKDLLEEEYERFGIRISPMDERLVQKQLYEYGEADYISVPSTFAEKTFIERGINSDKLIRVPMGVDLKRFRPVPKEDKVFRVICFGGGLRKGLHYLLEAMSQLKLPNSELLWIGGIGEELKPILAKYNGQYRHIRRVPHSELYKYYSQASVFVSPSLEDGWGHVVTEALACGLPVICTTNTGAADMIREGIDGFIVPIRDVEGLKSKITYLYEHEEERRAMGEAALQRIQEFTWDKYGERICSEYERIVLAKEQQAAAPDFSTVKDFYDLYWDLTELWGTCANWSEEEYDLHFKGILNSEDRVLDVGCGDARAYQQEVLSSVKELHGIDIDEKAVARARLKGVQAITHDLSKRLPYDDNYFDCVIILEVLEHLFDPMFALKEMWRVMKPGGILITSVPNAGYLRERLKVLFRGEVNAGTTDYSNPWKSAHIRFFNLSSFVHMIDCCGFHIEEVKSKGDSSVFDALCFLGAPGRFLAREARRWLPRVLHLAFLAKRWPSLFAPQLLLLAHKPR